jgi:hypothetical protein
MGSDETLNPQYQVGEGCLPQHNNPQYMADVSSLGPLLDPVKIRQTMASVHKYNFRRDLSNHDSVQRTFALNDEAALLVCDYAKAPRPRIPFPYYAEVFTGLEYSSAAQMIWAGLVREGIECIESTRQRHDGESRNPWDEAECGHHYVRAMAAWSGLLALSGFRYDGPQSALTVLPVASGRTFRCFWSTARGWGLFSREQTAAGTILRIRVDNGKLASKEITLRATGASTRATLAGRAVPHTSGASKGLRTFRFESPVSLKEGEELVLEVQA